MKTIFQHSKAGLKSSALRPLEVDVFSLPKEFLREQLPLPQLAEIDVVRHYTALSKRAFGVDDGFYPLGSCTMKYNAKLNEEVAALKGFTDIHPLQDVDSAQGSLAVLHLLNTYLCEITGMDAVSLQPCAGAHGEYTGLLLIAEYLKSKGERRNKVIIPDSAHGTNPASAALAGFETVTVRSDESKGVDLEHLKELVDEDTAALMFTNPTTLGLFEKNIAKVSKIVHDAGGLMYYDGANFNAIMGITKPADMGFDVVHLNLHKTFGTPHGGGGPGSGPVGCVKILEPFLPYPQVTLQDGRYEFFAPPQSIGKVTSFYGNFAVLVKALSYILTLGSNGLKEASECAVLNANYMKKQLEDLYETDVDRFCMHEFVLSLKKLKDKTGVGALDVAKALIDLKMHPPTMYFPLIVPEALMFEPTETESKQTLDCAVKNMRELYYKALENPDEVRSSPQNATITRPDEVRAARVPILKE